MTRAGRHLRRWVPMFVALALAVLSGPAATTLAGPAAAQPSGASDSSGPKFLKLTLDSVSPRAVTTTSDAVLTVTGTVTNVGDRPVEDVDVRLQLGAAITTGSGLRSTLRMDEVNYEPRTTFDEIAERLEPAERQQFTIRVGIRPGTYGASGSVPVTSSLGITEPGVYPLLLNVNGVPDYGKQARLDDARFLLPVLGLPAISTAGEAKGETGQPIPAPTEAPVAITTIWPLADRPRLVAGVTGPLHGKALLTDDELARELGAGGRLDQLVAALEAVLRPATGRDPGRASLASSICLAIDPDLLLTVSHMTGGYRVLASPSDPAGPTRDGSEDGMRAAKAWLDRLRTVASGMCTVALPFAQVDLSALAAVNDPELTARAIDAPADIVDSVLSVKSMRGVALPDAGSVDPGAATLLAGHGYHTAVLADTAVTTAESRSTATGGTRRDGGTVRNTASRPPERETTAPELVRLPAYAPPPVPETPPPAEPGLKAATFDIWSATALAAVGSNPPTPPFTPERVRYEVAHDSRVARLQDALGAVSWSALNPQAGGPRSLLLMPPQTWSANRDEATALLGQLDLLVRNGLATPRPFGELLAMPPDPRPFEVDYLSGVAEVAVPDQFFDPIRAQDRRIADLLSALAEVPQQEPTPQQYLTPLRDDLVRVLTLSDRSNPAWQADTVAQRRLDQTTRTLDTLFGKVTVLPPGGVYTLASEKSPLLLVARNDLPVAIRIKFRIGAPAETNITDIGEQILPAEGTRSFQIPTEVTDSRNLVIPISLTTPDGIALGNATSVSVRSNAYGQALAIITACAGALLLLLAGRRLWRRFRGQPDPADEGLDPGTRRRVNRYLRARRRVLQRQEEP
ncbi:DUF6049 family protein [Nocardia sp. CDC159]|uniref:DUF6049 family protein n=1 Tax=Nocardia pulmonis TaxID=2951408 RepID=A0A9X2EA83_9NOCA|nr:MULTISPECIES: DUF6049 family protein [Nocardia]MCM6776987.1 DUF6049 family protein [Nocardia pulmonis]MCM6789411.1 DUF6049 family protein [Nocardia sp. CDC159]